MGMRFRKLGMVAIASLLALTSTSLARVAPSTAAFRSSSNIELVRTVEVKGGTGGGRVIGDFFYVSTATGMHIYDISDPLKPRRLGHLGKPPKYPTLFAAQEDPDTNGEIYLSDRNGGLQVVDVRDVRRPTVVGETGGYQHTWSCISHCDYAYGADGAIVNVRKPNGPKLVGNWQDRTGIAGAHDVTPVTEDLAVVSTTPLSVIDVSRPLRPSVIATGTAESDGFAHGNLWPRKGKDRFLILGTENAFYCNAEPAFITTFDTRGWRESGELRPVDEYRVPDLDPNRSTPVNTLCGHWFDAAPSFHDGGLLAAAWYEDGMRLLDIDGRGRIEEVGYYIRDNAASSAAYWVTEEIVYLTDYQNGFDILRVRKTRL